MQHHDFLRRREYGDGDSVSKPSKKKAAPKNEPLMESEDYTDFVADSVEMELTRRRVLANDRLLYAVEDTEDWLLDIGASVDDLDGNQIAAMNRFILRRINGER